MPTRSPAQPAAVTACPPRSAATAAHAAAACHRSIQASTAMAACPASGHRGASWPLHTRPSQPSTPPTAATARH
ncbi:hypothetical protein G6F46_015548 [Rhizopus delemar]|nr:hypothetical protein G6F22_020728 [Rhizopus arrhizus]KAG1580203.1 hypothetical protein G6F46_015548 [Rhizopus delemar]